MLHALAALLALAVLLPALAALARVAQLRLRDRRRRRDRATFHAGFPPGVDFADVEHAIHDHRRLLFRPFVEARLALETSPTTSPATLRAVV